MSESFWERVARVINADELADAGEYKAFAPTAIYGYYACWIGHLNPEMTCGQRHRTKEKAQRCASAWAAKTNRHEARRSRKEQS